MNTNDAINLTASVLKATYPEIPVYTSGEPVDGPADPSFTVTALNTVHEKKLGRKYTRTFSMCIKYRPSAEDPLAQCNETADRLTEIFETMTNGIMRASGTNMSYKTESSILYFLMDIKSIMEKQEPDNPAMASLEVNENGK